MKFVRSVVAGTAVLVAGGVLYAGQAVAGPSAPVPAPGATTAAASADQLGRGAGVAWFYRALTDDQRACLADAKLQRPDGRLTDQQRTDLAAKVRAAVTACGVQLPQRLADRPRLGFAWASLTTEQQQCLAQKSLTRPLGRLTDAQKDAVRQSITDAAGSCGIGR